MSDSEHEDVIARILLLARLSKVLQQQYLYAMSQDNESPEWRQHWESTALLMTGLDSLDSQLLSWQYAQAMNAVGGETGYSDMHRELEISIYLASELTKVRARVLGQQDYTYHNESLDAGKISAT